MPIMFAKHTKTLDPRPIVAGQEVLAGACQIPFTQIADRLFEFPAKGEIVEIISGVQGSEEATEILESSGRKVKFIQGEQDPGGEFRLWQGAPCLEAIPVLSGGKALDLGCGSGRNSVILASMGYEVVALDNLLEALEMGRSLESRYISGAEPIRWLCADANEFSSLPQEKFDIILCAMFRPQMPLVELKPLLAPGGCLILETYSLFSHKFSNSPGKASICLSVADTDCWRDHTMHTFRHGGKDITRLMLRVES